MPDPKIGITRRALVAGAAATGVGVGIGVDRLFKPVSHEGLEDGESQNVVAFYGSRQAGIATPAQEFVNFASFDVRSESVEDLRSLLTSWTEAAAALHRGRGF